MPRQVRVEYEGAFYHVMARGDRREAIVYGDDDRRLFLQTLGEAAEKTGFRIQIVLTLPVRGKSGVAAKAASILRG